MSWDSMLTKFRALGGVAENVCLKEGQFGRGIFVCDPAVPARLFTPTSLLVPLDQIDFQGGHFRIAASEDIGEQARNFLMEYEQEFGWDTGRGPIEDLVRMVYAAPAELRALLNRPLNADTWLIEPAPTALRKCFATSRAIKVDGRLRYMPIIELCNHGRVASYEFDRGIVVQGVFAEEMLVGYAPCDPWTIFSKWGFASTSEDFAMSLNLGFETKAGPLRIRQDDIKEITGNVPFFPKVDTSNKTLRLPYLLLGHKKFPRLARGIFRRIVADAGRNDADELFDRIQHFNRTQFLSLIAASENAPAALGRLLRDAAGQQLEAMSWSMGAREV